MGDRKLPGGKVIRNVPDDMSDEDLMKRALRNGYTLADFQSNSDKVKIGIGETLDRAWGRIAGTLGGVDNKAAELLGQEAPEPGFMDKAAEASKRRTETTKDVQGGYATFGRMLPALATMPLTGGLGTQAAIGGATGALTGDNAGSGAAFGAGGAVLGNVAGRAASRFGNALRGKWAERAVKVMDEEGEAVRDLARMGFKMTPGQAAGEGMKQSADQIMSKSPILGTAHASIFKHNTRLLTQYGAKALGKDYTDIGQKALRNFDQVIDTEFNKVAAILPDRVPISRNTAAELQEWVSKKTLQKLRINPENPSISPRDYMNLRSRLLKELRKPSNSGKEGVVYENLIDALDDSAESVADPMFKNAYALARERYKSFLVLDKPGVVSRGGRVDAKKAAKEAQRIFKDQFSRKAPTRSPATRDFLDAIYGMSTDRMTGSSPNSITQGANISVPGLLGIIGDASGLAALSVGGGPVGLGLGVGLGVAAPRIGMAAPASAISGSIGAGLGRGLSVEAEREYNKE